MASPVKQQILSAIDKVEDAASRTILLLMLQVVEEIGGKIDAILADEKSLREAVLNGHTEQHDAHHEWVAAKILEEDQDKGSRRRIREGIVEKAIWAAILFTAGALASKAFG
jgi:hypothetical protein